MNPRSRTASPRRNPDSIRGDFGHTGWKRAARWRAVVFLIAWFAGFPLLQSYHLLTATHDHRFCLEHDRFEDAPLSPDDRFLTPTEGLSTDGTARLAVGVLARNAHGAPCSVLNSPTAREPEPSEGGRPETNRAVARISVGFLVDAVSVLGPVFLFAPKNSPPSLFS